jgi:hypothetical protein
MRLDSNALTRLQVRIEHSSIRQFRKHLASMIVALHQSSSLPILGKGNL